MSLGRGNQGQALLHCHLGCSVEEILTQIGLSWQDLYPAESQLWPRESKRPDIRELEDLYRQDKLRPGDVTLGPLPDTAPSDVSLDDMRRVRENMKLLFGLHAAVGEHRPMPYSARFGAGQMSWPNGHARMNRVLRGSAARVSPDPGVALRPASASRPGDVSTAG